MSRFVLPVDKCMKVWSIFSSTAHASAVFVLIDHHPKDALFVDDKERGSGLCCPRDMGAQTSGKYKENPPNDLDISRI